MTMLNKTCDMVKRIVLALLMIGLFAACEEIDQTNEDITQEAATESPGDDVAPIRYVTSRFPLTALLLPMMARTGFISLI